MFLVLLIGTSIVSVLAGCPAGVSVTEHSLAMSGDPEHGEGPRADYFKATQDAFPVADKQVTTAIIVVHGLLRNANDYYCNMRRGLDKGGRSGPEMMIVAPRFKAATDESRFDAMNMLVWAPRAHGMHPHWRTGTLSSSNLQQFTSYDVIDRFLLVLANASLYPRLKRIVVAGHSSGAAFVNTYSLINPLDESIRDRGYDLRYVVGNPTSYTYVDHRRATAVGPVCCQVPKVRATAADLTFEPPWASANCSEYDQWPYGLEGYSAWAAGSNKLKREVISRYPERRVFYLLGTRDTCNKYCDCNGGFLDVTCPAMLQGTCRFERGVIHMEHLKTVYGADALSHRVLETPCSHSSRCTFRSQAFLQDVLQ